MLLFHYTLVSRMINFVFLVLCYDDDCEDDSVIFIDHSTLPGQELKRNRVSGAAEAFYAISDEYRLAHCS